MQTRSVDDLDGGTFDVADLPPVPAYDPLTLRLYRRVQIEIGRAYQRRAASEVKRLERIEQYLIDRFERETPEEAEVYEVIWPPVEMGGES